MMRVFVNGMIAYIKKEESIEKIRELISVMKNPGIRNNSEKKLDKDKKV